VRVAGQNIWVGKGTTRPLRLEHRKGGAGNRAPEYGGELVESGDELLMLGAQIRHARQPGQRRFTYCKIGAKGATTLAATQGAG